MMKRTELKIRNLFVNENSDKYNVPLENKNADVLPPLTIVLSWYWWINEYVGIKIVYEVI